MLPASFEQILTREVMRISGVIAENAAHSKIVLQKD